MNESQLKFRCRGWVWLTILPVLLAGCVSQSDAPPAGSANAVPVVDAPKTQAQIAEPVVRPFPEGSLYALLSAEVAGYRGDYQFALDTYLVEARKTGDPGVAARVTRLAAYMKADEAVLEGRNSGLVLTKPHLKPVNF